MLDNWCLVARVDVSYLLYRKGFLPVLGVVPNTRKTRHDVHITITGDTNNMAQTPLQHSGNCLAGCKKLKSLQNWEKTNKQQIHFILTEPKQHIKQIHFVVIFFKGIACVLHLVTDSVIVSFSLAPLNPLKFSAELLAFYFSRWHQEYCKAALINQSLPVWHQTAKNRFCFAKSTSCVVLFFPGVSSTSGTYLLPLSVETLHLTWPCFDTLCGTFGSYVFPVHFKYSPAGISIERKSMRSCCRR